MGCERRRADNPHMSSVPPSVSPGRRLRPLTPNGHCVALALRGIDEWPGLTLNELAQRSGLSRSTTGLSVALGEQRGWMRARGGTWRLTPGGRDALNTTMPPEESALEAAA
jgi:coproporphyrinogen III oxidase-like Fe-S oxidoreductase